MRSGDIRVGSVAALALLHVLIHAVHGAEVAEVPVERSFFLDHAVRDRWHDDVAAVAGVARDCELPRLIGG